MLRVYRYDSKSAQLGASAADSGAPAVIPILGYKKIKAFLRTPSGPATLVIQQYMKANSTAVATATFTTAAPFPAEVDSGDGVPVVGELAGITLTNGPTAQIPECLVRLEDRSAEQ